MSCFKNCNGLFLEFHCSLMVCISVRLLRTAHCLWFPSVWRMSFLYNRGFLHLSSLRVIFQWGSETWCALLSHLHQITRDSATIAIIQFMLMILMSSHFYSFNLWCNSCTSCINKTWLKCKCQQAVWHTHMLMSRLNLNFQKPWKLTQDAFIFFSFFLLNH